MSETKDKNPLREEDKATEHRTDGPAPRREARFTPGEMLAGRYRIVALLGKGGMGEVYRADDTKLGQPVALKFLPRWAAADRAKIARLYDEVRIGRQVSHPNVCRLYDIGEWEEHHFLAMEYVDGEDLASLLRRIGHLPHDKALDIARDLCAGLAAAHGLGVVHRDLKPANIMLDGRGTARITDFGLAAFASDLTERREVVGTPAYMAPEQLKGGEVTTKTDLYALGLILYEIFTGKRRFSGSTFGEILEEHSSTRSGSVTTETKDIEPAVQRVILRCLEEEPAMRPASIHSVIAALPGGDPLQAAIDAGETPSPQMVAASGASGEIPVALGWATLFTVFVGLIAITFLYPRISLYGIIEPRKSPEFLYESAKDMLSSLGYGSAEDSAYAFDFDEEFFEHIKEKDKSVRRWEQLRTSPPGAIQFTYRQSPRPLLPWKSEGKVWPDDPPSTVPGMAEVRLDTSGRLIRFSAVPPRHHESNVTSARVDWDRFFRFAGLDITQFQPSPAVWTAPHDTDSRMAWDGLYPGRPNDKIHIEAASFRGRPVWFSIFGKWHRPPAPKAWVREFSMGETLWLILSVSSLVVAAVLARRNLLRGRGDRKGTVRTGAFVFITALASQLLRRDHVSDLSAEWGRVILPAIAEALFPAALTALTYIAVEPYVRRHWPFVLISWNRVLAGRLSDPMVGRDVLFGVAAGVIVALCQCATVLSPLIFGEPPLSPVARWLSPIMEIRQFLYIIPRSLFEAAVSAVRHLAFLFVLFLLFRRRWAAVAGLFLFIAVGVNVRGENIPFELFFGLIIGGIAVALLTRCGLLAVTVTIFIVSFIEAAPLTVDSSAWFFGRSLVALALIAALATYGFYRATAGKPLFGKPLLED